MVSDARGRPPVRLAIAIVIATAVAVAVVVITFWSERAILGRATRLAREGAPDKRPGAIETLRQLGDAGVPVLLALALDPTPVPLGFDPGEYSMFLPRDTAGDLALDALRHLRMGRPSPRALEWGADYAGALNEWRGEEFAAAVEWWEAKRKAAGTEAEGDAR